ncbi:hypothetical protein [Fusobacterium pseudoperiodonticum]|uniref:Uncharacterized protein n=1 Tax=Fusobacterium pseudoperiodonticum TaxID=2663009 RepID=A0A2G9EI28_9FUSO|nr:hypothetical protein [Fusobacterium pseudoperiodonticum]ATV63699.1 hypothetical protein CTM78_04370 [Fusobacterium pseudoperiodonticum]ATV67334.1 hypothetical protein CTM92_01060 [Fusobacterium pseudoperiodonticum]PIM80563.1 hypothetical protein CTM71_09410 [Fusobacterium pseudoperiodonticum]
MKKIFLSLSLLLFVSCVNLDKLNIFDKNDSKVAEKSTANSNKNVASSKKDKQKKSAPIVPTKGTKSKNLLRDAEAMPEDNYVNKVKKYKAYNSLVAFNPTYKSTVEAKMGDLKSKIESTYTVKVSVTDLILQNLTKKEDFNSVGSKVFNYANTNPDLNLLVDITSVNYSKPTINVKTAPKEYSEEYVNSEGNKVLNVVKYYENETTKTTALSFVVTYKLVSNLTGEVLFHYKKTVDKSYKESWKNYYVSSFRMNKRKQIPSDEPEKSVPTKEQIYQIAYEEMYDMIQKEINNLPSIK